MRMTSRKKEILSYFEPDNLEWVTGEMRRRSMCRAWPTCFMAWCRSISATSSNQPGDARKHGCRWAA
jgi:hypothetical protein